MRGLGAAGIAIWIAIRTATGSVTEMGIGHALACRASRCVREGGWRLWAARGLVRVVRRRGDGAGSGMLGWGGLVETLHFRKGAGWV